MQERGRLKKIKSGPRTEEKMKSKKTLSVRGEDKRENEEQRR
jgi:hypothetical protein